MGNFFKGLGKGIFNILIIPVYIVGLALSAVVGLFVFVIELFKKILMFFSGKTLSSDLPEDIEAKRMIEEANNPKEENNTVEVVQAEIATEPTIDFKEIDAPHTETKAISNDEDVDFLIDDSPLQIDAILPEVELQQNAPIEDVVESKEEEPATYEPKKGEF